MALVVTLTMVSGILATSNNPCSSCHGSLYEYCNLLPDDSSSSLPITFTVGSATDVKIAVEIVGSGTDVYYNIDLLQVTLSSLYGKVSIENEQQEKRNLRPGNKIVFNWSVTGGSAGSDTLNIDLYAHNPHYDCTFSDSYSYDISVVDGNSLPNVVLISPVGGEEWSGINEIRWYGSDVDEDTVTYTINISLNGSNWQSIDIVSYQENQSCTLRTYSWNTASVPDGIYYLKITADDGAGGIGENTSSSFIVDNTPPVTTDNCDGTWHNTSFAVHLSRYDALSSFDSAGKTYYTIDGTDPNISSSQGTEIQITQDGIYTIKYFSVDDAGNAEVIKTSQYPAKLDTQTPFFSNWNVSDITIESGDVNVSVVCSDALSGIERGYVQYFVNTSEPSDDEWIKLCDGFDCTITNVNWSKHAGKYLWLRAIAWDTAMNKGVSRVVSEFIDNNTMQKPDAVAVNLTTNATLMHENYTYTIEGRVRNDGNAVLKYAEVKFYLDYICTENLLHSQIIQNLGVDDMMQINFSWITIPGSHRIHMVIENSTPSEHIGNNEIFIVIYVNYRPRAEITSYTQEIFEDEVANFIGTGSDVDGSIVEYIWKSSIDGYLGSSQSIFVPLTLGNHTIALQVRDDKGLWSYPVSVEVSVISSSTPSPPKITSVFPQSSNVSVGMRDVVVFYVECAGNVSIVWYVDGELYATNVSYITYPAVELGMHTVDVSIRNESSGLFEEISWQVICYEQRGNIVGSAENSLPEDVKISVLYGGIALLSILGVYFIFFYRKMTK